MSAELTSRLRQAAGGPVAAVDVADLRRRAGRRAVRQATGVVASVVLAVASVVTIVDLAAGPGRPTIVGGPDDVPPPTTPADPEEASSTEGTDPEPHGPETSVAPIGPDGELVPIELVLEQADDGCELHITVTDLDRALITVVGLPGWGAASCGLDVIDREDGAPSWWRDPSTGMEPYTVNAPALDGSDHPEQLLIGLVEGDAAEVQVRTDQVEMTVSTVPVVTEGTIPLRGWAVAVPVPDDAHAPVLLSRRAVTAEGPRGAGDVRGFPLFRATWAEDGVPPEPSYGTSGQPIDDVPITLPDEVEPFGTWRPARAPVDLSPLGMRHTADTWYLTFEAGEPVGRVGADEVAERLGSRSELDELCRYLEDSWQQANLDLDLSGHEPEDVVDTLLYLVTGQEDLRLSSGGLWAIAAACGLPNPGDGPP